MALTKKQEAFCLEYLKDLNATQAAIRAGYSKNCAGEIGFANLRKVQIQAKIAKAAAKRAERTRVDADDVVRGLYRVFVKGTEKVKDVELRDAINAASVLLRHLEPIPDDVESMRRENARLRALVEQYEIDHES